MRSTHYSWNWMTIANAFQWHVPRLLYTSLDICITMIAAVTNGLLLFSKCWLRRLPAIWSVFFLLSQMKATVGNHRRKLPVSVFSLPTSIQLYLFKTKKMIKIIKWVCHARFHRHDAVLDWMPSISGEDVGERKVACERFALPSAVAQRRWWMQRDTQSSTWRSEKVPLA